MEEFELLHEDTLNIAAEMLQMPSLVFTGTQVNYYFVCKRNL